MLLKYETRFVWSEENDCFDVIAPELPGCIAHGDTRNEALRELQTAMDLWISTAHECGDTIPQAKVHKLAYP